MAIDCPALPNNFPAGAPRLRWRDVASYWDRWIRTVRLCLHVLRMWLGAVLLGGRLSERWREPIVRQLSARLLSILRIRIEVSGAVPAAVWPVLMVSNHVSWLDSYVINAFHGARFVAKSEVARWPFIGTIARRFDTLFIVRRSLRSAGRTKDAIARLLGRGLPVAIFPEGTTSEGRTIRRFHPALLQAAVDANVPVQPIAITYRTVDGRHAAAAAFIDDLSIWSSLRLILSEPTIVARVTFCPPLSCRGQTRRELAYRTRHSIAAALDIPTHMLEPDRFAPPVARSQSDTPKRPATAPSPAEEPRRWHVLRNAIRLRHEEAASG